MTFPAPYPARAPYRHGAGGRPANLLFLGARSAHGGHTATCPAAKLGRRAMTALWALRMLVIVISAMVIYTFFSQLGG